MITYRLNQSIALLVSLLALYALVSTHGDPELHLRLALLIYSSLLIATITTFAMKNLVGQLRYQRFGWLLLVTSLGIYLLFSSSNSLLMGVGWSASGLGAIFLVNHANNRRSRRAVLEIGTWFLISDSAFWGALFLAHFHHIKLFAAINSSAEGKSTLYNAIAILITISGLIRSGAFPAMRWLILTSEAPSPLSAFLHAGIVNGFGYLIIVLPIVHRAWVGIIVVSLLTITISLSIMRHRHDEKGKLANGTSMQMAFMALEGILGIPGIVLLHIVGHGSYKSWSFLRAGGAPLRKKNAMPLPVGKENRAAITILAFIYPISIGISVAFLGSEYLLNISIFAIALASSLIFISKLPKRLLVQSASLSAVLFFIYICLEWFVSQLFPKISHPGISLVVLVSALLLFITNALRFTPREWTLRIASRANRYLPSRKKLSVALRNLQQVSISDLQVESMHQVVEVASAPFVEGMALSKIVAQDSLVGLHHMDFHEAAEIARGYGISLYASASQYLSWLEQGLIRPEVIIQCLRESDLNLEFDSLVSIAKAHHVLEDLEREPSDTPFPTPEESLAANANWWSSQSWYDGDSGDSSGAYQMWHKALPHKYRELLEPQPIDALCQILPFLIKKHQGEITDSQILGCLQQLISIDISWFTYAKGLGIKAQTSLLALRAALLLLSDSELERSDSLTTPHAKVWQLALERSYAENLRAGILKSSTSSANDFQHEVSIVTCIDVRSDLLRVQAEQIPGVRTVGMAGFFGVDLCLTHLEKSGTVRDTHAPIILTPSLEVTDNRKSRFLWDFPSLWKYAARGSGALAIAEGFGLVNGVLSALNTFAPGLSKKLNRYFEPTRWLDSTGMDLSFLSDSQKLQYATNILAVITAHSAMLTKEVIFVGHGADASNTPFRSMYECGACGGNNGGLNARFAANLMNDVVVQSLLTSKYPGETFRFFAAEHNTTAGTFEIDPLQEQEVKSDSSSKFKELVGAVSTLPRRKFPTSSELIAMDAKFATAWWQVFPEWGLSGNAACIIGPRELTRNVELSSRVFLHEYAWEEDLDGQILETILSGPGVVMQMINSAYNVAITSPQNFSSGDKTRHNVVGEAGVLLGAEGPLMRGMPWQAISPHADLSKGVSEGHIPIRLQIFVAAPESILIRAINQSALAPLVAGDWLSIHSLLLEISSPASASV